MTSPRESCQERANTVIGTARLELPIGQLGSLGLSKDKNKDSKITLGEHVVAWGQDLNQSNSLDPFVDREKSVVRFLIC